MVNPLDIMPVLALAFMIVCLPILAEPPVRLHSRRRPRGVAR
jgi:hypothetical protein